MPEKRHFLWIDMEMSGLDVEKCHILEVAAIVTNENFESLEEFQAIVYQPDSVLDAMDTWCKETHGKSGLTEAVKKGELEAQVEQKLVSLVDRYFPATEKLVLCGNSIGQDRKFIDKYMPLLAKRLHYRMVDVTSFKEIFRTKYSLEYKKANSHRALDDIHESINELRYYLSYVQAPPHN